MLYTRNSSTGIIFDYWQSCTHVIIIRNTHVWPKFWRRKRSKIRELWGGSSWFAYSKTSLHLNTNWTYDGGGGILGPIASMVFPPCETLISGRKMSHKKWSLFYVFIPSQRRRAAGMQANVRVFKIQLKIVSVNS